MAKYTKISEVRAALERVDAKLPQPPYRYHFSIDRDGNFIIRNDTSLVPEEVEKLVHWLIKFYEIEV